MSTLTADGAAHGCEFRSSGSDARGPARPGVALPTALFFAAALTAPVATVAGAVLLGLLMRRLRGRVTGRVPRAEHRNPHRTGGRR